MRQQKVEKEEKNVTGKIDFISPEKSIYTSTPIEKDKKVIPETVLSSLFYI